MLVPLPSVMPSADVVTRKAVTDGCSNTDVWFQDVSRGSDGPGARDGGDQ